MRSLRSRVIVVVALAALLPVTAVGLFARYTLLDRARIEHERLLTATAVASARKAESAEQTLSGAARSLCDNDVVDAAVLTLALDTFDEGAQARLSQRLRRAKERFELDAIEALNAGTPSADDASVLASTLEGRAGASDPALVAAALEARDHAFVHVSRAPGSHGGRSLVASCIAERTGARVVITTSLDLDRIARELALGAAPAIVALAGADGSLPSFPGGAPEGARRDVHAFQSPNGAPAAKIIALVDDRAFEEELAALDRGLVIAGLLGVLVAMLFGGVLALRLSKPLAELEHAASRVGAGDLESTIAYEAGGEVGRALGAFNQMTRELRGTRERLLRAERIAAWRDIARRIAHEIKNPLSPIQVSIETMRKTYAKKHPDFDEIFEESTLTILEEVGRLKRIVEEFSRFARLPRPKPVELDVRDVVQHVTGLHAGGDVDMVVLGSAVPRVRADREQLTQVLVNLVQNAADAARSKHGASGGRVTIGLEPIEHGVAVSVSDNGPGVGPDERLRIFEPYYTTKSGGTGLGLAIVHRIVGDHGGTIEVLDSALGGATFRFTLTREGPPPEAEASSSDLGAALGRA